MMSEMEARALVRVLGLRIRESKERMTRTKDKAKIAKEIRNQQDWTTEIVTLNWVLEKK